MGLDWTVQPTESGISPMETAGALSIDPNNQASIDAFKQIVQHNLEVIWQRQDDRATTDYKYWSRPVEVIMADEITARNGATVWMADTIPSDCEGLASVRGIAAGDIDFRGKVIAGMEGLPDHLADACFGLDGEDCDQALDLADELEAFTPHSPQDVQVRREAVAWLRYWAGRGHPIHAWF